MTCLFIGEMYFSVILTQGFLFVTCCALVQVKAPFTVVKFERDINFDNFSCANDIITTRQAISLVECLQHCRTDVKGIGDSLLYSEATGVCQCHRSSNTSDLGCALVIGSGYRFYSLVRDPVTTSAPTTVAAPSTTLPTNLGVTFIPIWLFMLPKTIAVGTTLVTTTVETSTITTTEVPVTWDFRLVNGSATTGRLEVYHNGIWGAVYGFSFSVDDAMVMCRDILGLANFGYPIYGDYFGVPETAVGLTKDYDTENDLICYQNLTCNPDSWKSENETEFKEFGTVGLDCKDVQMDIQLADKLTPSSGRLEVRLLNQWGTVCGDDDWQDAPLFCRYFGYDNGSFELAGYEATSGPIWIHGSFYNCDSGNETYPEECQWSAYAKDYFHQNCNHTSDVILQCL